ncbi:MAG: hypothetical protein OH319_04010 [Candidatus Parvarchaeota archaeon]|nr:hypothetical protein [Candidatus Jingweiarchaeum tengchongense]MCW1298049.1 hypothetical protein [Candidatus Jingweiarchaeum tengchongense]MCW1300151.1 hypothetical protein [Candidatus Jingweiarchaeum tengchongense]MCW1304361.1 hypothetical protein [Candidatus Jingweiarchaeum tengchongense]MCW1305919.1 hypothetical protein [Candidatus Jingweiarchaeum tengchongense]
MGFIEDLKNFENSVVKIGTLDGAVHNGILKTIKDDYVILAAESSVLIPFDKICSITIIRMR